MKTFPTVWFYASLEVGEEGEEGVNFKCGNMLKTRSDTVILQKYTFHISCSSNLDEIQSVSFKTGHRDLHVSLDRAETTLMTSKLEIKNKSKYSSSNVKYILIV